MPTGILLELSSYLESNLKRFGKKIASRCFLSPPKLSVMSTYPSISLQDGQRIPSIGYGLGTAWYAIPGGDSEGNRELIDAVKTALQVG